ncbi:TolC family protein [Xanthomonas hyacinthi]|uniref:TolC family protein n=1 Tax=Xanthomonas hyacinthi TaxID=56455 RepID=A0A2S7ERR6_9XANT|nr:TolC family protein [Xanthomonas hyacinthi]PPU95793.1 hypothetical protein XhyaCFBP1156_17395 [Xanthomonas hyacinthi]QGY75357.1 TolC family protein [Xanthomonas hyacinthi]
MKIAAIFILSLLNSYAPCCIASSLSEIYQATRENNPQYAGFDSSVEVSKQELVGARAKFFPTANAFYTLDKENVEYRDVEFRGYSKSFSRGIQVAQKLFSAENIYAYRASKQSYEGARYQRDYNVNLLEESLIEAYLTSVLQAKIVDVYSRYEDAYAQALKITRRQYAGGYAAKVDTAQAESYYEYIAAQRLEYASDLDSSLHKLSRMSGLDLKEVGPFKESQNFSFVENRSLLAWYQLAQTHNSKLAYLERLIRTSAEKVKSARSARLPEVSLEATYSSVNFEQFSLSNDGRVRCWDKYVGINVSVPLFSGFLIESNIKTAESQRDLAVSNLEIEVAQIRNDISDYYAYISNSSKRLEASARSVAAAILSEELIGKGYKIGQRDFTDLAVAIGRRAECELQLAYARYNYLVAQVKLIATTRELGQQDMETISRILSY